MAGLSLAWKGCPSAVGSVYSITQHMCEFREANCT